MPLRAEQLEAHLAKTLAALYVIHGDEPLLALEAADAIRAAARRTGHAEREVLQVERGFDWSALTHAGASLSLFGGAKIVELRIPSGKPGSEGAGAIVEYCARAAPEILTIVTLPRLDRASQSSAWFRARHRGNDATALPSGPTPSYSRMIAGWASAFANQRRFVASISHLGMAEGELLEANILLVGYRSSA